LRKSKPPRKLSAENRLSAAATVYENRRLAYFDETMSNMDMLCGGLHATTRAECLASALDYSFNKARLLKNIKQLGRVSRGAKESYLYESLAKAGAKLVFVNPATILVRSTIRFLISLRF
jgi:hypothetical protein